MSREKAIKYVHEAIYEHMDIIPLRYKLDSDLADLGCDSLDAVEIMIKLEDKLQVKELKVDLNKVRTVKDIVDLVEKYITTVQ